jgi:TolB-like protein/Flp pilus assembly protein TadD
MNAPVGSIIGFATSPGRTASDGTGKNGLYTSGLLQFLGEPGITAIQMFQKVTAYVQERSGGAQLPWVATSLTGDIYLVQESGKTDNTIFYGNKNNPPDYDNAAASISRETSIAVLPFNNYTGSPDQEHLVAGQNETLINELSKISQFKPLRVIYRGSVNSFRNYDKPMQEIAKEIDVDFVVEGSVMSMGDSLIIQLRLVQVMPEEKIVWAQSYTRDIPGILGLYSGIANQIANKLDLDLSEDEKKDSPITRKVNPESYKAYLRGMYHLSLLTPESIDIGMDYLHEAVRIDPAEPLAYAGLALGYTEIAHGSLDPGDALPKAEAAALRALSIDSTLAEAWSALGEAKLYYDHDFETANKYLAKALELNPNLGVTYFHVAWAEYLYGNMEKAIEAHILSKRYDPFHPSCTSWLGGLYCYDGQYEKAIETAKEGIEIQRDHPVAYYILGITYGIMGNEEEAMAYHQELATISPEWKFALGYTNAIFGHREEAEKILKEYESMSESPWNAYCLMMLNSVLGNIDEAFRWLNFRPLHAYSAWVAVLPEFNNMKDDPRFDEFVKNLNIPK